MNRSNVTQLRPNVTPATQPVLELIPVLIVALLAVPWLIGAWRIVRWIFR